ncbi:MAG: metal-dependent hydrolase [Hungatella sp.]
MLGRTHFFIGISAALAVMQPSSMPTLVAGAGAAAIGGMISDIDSGTSQAHREADKIMTAAIAVTAIVILADYKFHVGIYERLMRNSSIARLLTGAMAFIIICTYGSSQPHRSFMHSFLSLFMLTACIDVIYPDAAPYFAVAYASHLALDLLNYRRLRLIWPMKRGISLGFCSSQGLINHLLMSAGMVCVVLNWSLLSLQDGWQSGFFPFYLFEY